MRRHDDRFKAVDVLEFVASVSAVPVMPESFPYMRKKFWNVIDAIVWFSCWIFTPSLASTAGEDLRSSGGLASGGP